MFLEEYNGPQHYVPHHYNSQGATLSAQILRDDFKEQKCNELDIVLIEIPNLTNGAITLEAYLEKALGARGFTRGVKSSEPIEEVKFKKCSQCKTSKPSSVSYFRRDSGKDDGLRSECKECASKKSKKEEHIETKEVTPPKDPELLLNNTCMVCKKYKTHHEFDRKMYRLQHEICISCKEELKKSDILSSDAVSPIDKFKQETAYTLSSFNIPTVILKDHIDDITKRVEYIRNPPSMSVALKYDRIKCYSILLRMVSLWLIALGVGHKGRILYKEKKDKINREITLTFDREYTNKEYKVLMDMLYREDDITWD